MDTEKGKMNTFYNADGSITATQDVGPALKHAKEMRSQQRGRCKDWVKVASIPTVIIEKLINEGVVKKDCLSDPEQMAKIFAYIKRDARAFLCTDKKV